jgi:hypothetical protein
MSEDLILLFAALGASIFLALEARARGWAIGAAVVAGIGLLMAFRVVSIGMPHLNLIFYGALCALGVVLVLRVAEKMKVVAATVVAAVGAFGLLEALL